MDQQKIKTLQLILKKNSKKFRKSIGIIEKSLFFIEVYKKRIVIINTLISDKNGPVISDMGKSIIRKYIILSIILFLEEKKIMFFI